MASSSFDGSAICCVCGWRHVFRSTPLSRPNKVGLKCPSVRPSVHKKLLRFHGFLNKGTIPKAYRGRIFYFCISFCVTWLWSWQSRSRPSVPYAANLSCSLMQWIGQNQRWRVCLIHFTIWWHKSDMRHIVWSRSPGDGTREKGCFKIQNLLTLEIILDGFLLRLRRAALKKETHGTVWPLLSRIPESWK